MKLRVIHENGNQETIDVIEPTIKYGKELDRLVSAEGCEYFFTKDGYYDGWGKNRPLPKVEEIH